MRLFLYEGQPRAEFTVDGYDSWSVRILRDGCITAKGIESGLDENNRIVIHLPNTLPVGVYTMELSIIKNHMERRSMMCGVIEVGTCDQYANIPTGVVVGTTQTDMDIYFEITESVWEQGMSSYDYWKIDHPDGTLQEYLDTLQPVQSDWTQTDNTLPDFIKNKPNVFSISSRDIDTMGAVTGLFLITDSSRGGIIISSGLFNYAEQVWIDVEHGYIKTRMMNLGVWGAWSDPIYQPTLISGINIKTINNESILGSGNIDIQGGSGDSSLVHWTFTQEGPFESPTWDTDGHKYSDIASTLNDGNTLLVTMKDLDATNGLFAYWMGGFLLPLQDTTSMLAFQLTEGTNDSINVTSITLSHSVIETISPSNAPTERSVTLYGDDTINGTITNVAKVEVDSDGVEIITSNGHTATYNGNEIYAKPSSGIPKADLASAVQTSLNKADTAVQEETDPTVQTWAKDGLLIDGVEQSPMQLGFSKPIWGYISNNILVLGLYTTDDPNLHFVQITGILSSNDPTQGWSRAGDSALPTVGLVYAKVNEKYTKPSTGIPLTDLAQAVRTSLGKADTALQSQEQVDWNETDNTDPSFIRNKPTIPDVSNLAEKIVVVDASTMPSTLAPNKVYQFGTLTGSVTIPPFASVPSGDNEAKIWCFTFETGTTAPTITWSAGITNWVGGSAPTINAGKKYEVSVMNGIGAILEA
jgi:hypothetical protein